MGRTLLALLAGLVAMVLTVFLLESAGHMVFPPPANMDFSDPAAQKAFMESLPIGALAFVILAWAVGALVGSYVAATIARQHRLAVALVVGVVMIALSVATMAMIPHPLWMIVLGVALPLPMAWLGARVATKA